MGGGRQQFHLQPRDLQVEKILAAGKNNPNMSWWSLSSTCLNAISESSRTYGLFTIHFDKELLQSNNHNSYKQAMQSIIGVAKVLEDVETSHHNRPPYRDVQRFLEQDFCKINDDNDAEIVRKFKEYFTARIIVRMDKEMNADNLQILSFSDDRATMFKPSWWQAKGICYALDSYVGKLEFVAKAFVEGKAQVRLSGAVAGHHIDYERLTINGTLIFDELTVTRHDKPYVYDINVKAGEEIKVQVEWLPHRSDT